MIEELKKKMQEDFEMTDLGLMRFFFFFFFFQVKRSVGEIFFSQEKYYEGLLKRFNVYLQAHSNMSSHEREADHV